jgi:hypothetical protein
LEEVPWALVDLGWLLTCQQSLQKLLHLWGRKVPVRGYYFGLKADRLPPSESGLSEGLFYQLPGDSIGKAAIQEIFNYPTMIEHVIGCADHPSVHHYDSVDGKMGAAFAATMDQKSARYVHDVHAAVSEFAAENKDLAGAYQDDDVCRSILGTMVLEFFKNPSRASVLALQDLTISSDQNGLYSVPLVRPVPLSMAMLSFLPNFLISPERKTRGVWWPEGSLAITAPVIRRVVRLSARLGQLRFKLRQFFSRARAMIRKDEK